MVGKVADRWPPISQVLCTLSCCRTRGTGHPDLKRFAEQSVPPTHVPGTLSCCELQETKPPDLGMATQTNTLSTAMDLGRPDTEAAGDVERDEYEINMFYLFRLFNHKRFHKLIPGDLDEKTQLSLNRLIHFNEHLPGAGAKRQRARTRFRVGKEEYLTALAKYWRNLPDKEEMMKFQDIWEHVAQRPLACEGLMEAEPSPNDERHRWTTLNTSRDRPLAKRLRIW